ncbi:MAG: HAD-IIB family hydrolase [Acholeplasmataceae bacterium]
MKTAIYFDFDHTLFFNDKGVVLPQTMKLIKALASREDVILGLATGRSRSKIDIIDDLLPYFDHFVMINGSMLYIKDKLVADFPIKKEDIIEVIEAIQDRHINLGMVNEVSDCIIFDDQRVIDAMNALRIVHPDVNPNFHLEHDVYQLWIFADDEKDIDYMESTCSKFKCYPWHVGGADFIYPHVNKASGIEALRSIDPYDRLIVVGDGTNDLQMIELADIGIAMGNARDESIKEKAQYVAPHINEDKMYDFFESIGLI